MAVKLRLFLHKPKQSTADDYNILYYSRSKNSQYRQLHMQQVTCGTQSCGKSPNCQLYGHDMMRCGAMMASRLESLVKEGFEVLLAHGTLSHGILTGGWMCHDYGRHRADIPLLGQFGIGVNIHLYEVGLVSILF